MTFKPASEEREELDPVYLHARREMIVIVLLFLAFCLWSVGVCYLFGYRTPGQTPPTGLVLGMPAWVFWGLFVPWIVVDLVAVWFCFFYMKDDDLGEAHEGADLAEQIEREKAEDAAQGGKANV